MSRLIFTMAAFTLLFGGVPAQATTLLFGSGTCTDQETGECITLRPSSPTVQTVTKATFSFPAAGSAIVRWSGSMQCTNLSGLAGNNFGVADFAAVVTRSATDPVDYRSRNGYRAPMRIPPYGEANYSIPVTIDASVYGGAKAGANTYFLRMRVLRIDTGVYCTLLTGSFTGTFNTQ